MGVRYEWADDKHIIMNIYVETPWSWQEYLEMIDELMPMLGDLNHPCATVVETSHMGTLPKDGNIIHVLIEVDKKMPDNVFASVIVGTGYTVRVFMNVLMKLRPGAQRIALFTKTMEEAYEKIMERYEEQIADET